MSDPSAELAGAPRLPLLDRLFREDGTPGPWHEVTPRAWADHEMAWRYAATLAPDDEVGSVAQRCHSQLCEEHIRLVGALRRKSGFRRLFEPSETLDDGLDWDYGPEGAYQPHMVTFKSLLLGASRALRGIPAEDRASGGPATAGVAHLVRAAYTARANMKARRCRLDAKAVIQAANANDLGRLGSLLAEAQGAHEDRWVSWRTHAFLAWHRVGARWAWDISQAAAFVGAAE